MSAAGKPDHWKFIRGVHGRGPVKPRKTVERVRSPNSFAQKKTITTFVFSGKGKNHVSSRALQAPSGSQRQWTWGLCSLKKC